MNAWAQNAGHWARCVLGVLGLSLRAAAAHLHPLLCVLSVTLSFSCSLSLAFSLSLARSLARSLALWT